jgi:integrase
LFIASHRVGWRNLKHANQWTNTLKTYVGPIFGNLPVSSVDVALVIKALEPIWATKPETASRVRGRVESILDWAAVRGYREGDNPARWRGHLDKLLPRRSKVRSVTHHPALPYAEVAEFVSSLRNREGVSALALEFVILTATRTGEVLGARWPEMDFKTRVWTIPAAKTKSGREHRIPQSSATLLVLERARQFHIDDNDHVFPGDRRAVLSNMALLMLLRRMGRADLTTHGFRSTLRDWAAERTNFPREVAELALAHAVSDKVEAAYRRGDLFEKRRRLMEAWAEFCAKNHKATDQNLLSFRR